jgi:hypothetical protein
MRQVGIANAEANVKGISEVEEEIEFKFTSAGYALQASHYMGDVKDASGNTPGYKMMFVFTKDEAPTARKTLKDA